MLFCEHKVNEAAELRGSPCARPSFYDISMLIFQGVFMRFEETIGISALLNQLEHKLNQKIEQILRPLGLSMPQYSVLSSIELERRLTNAELSRRCFVTPQTMNRILKNLLRLKLVHKKASPDHGLKLFFELTPKAEKLICHAHILVNTIEAKMISSLSQKEYRHLEAKLNDFLNNLNAN